MTAQIITTGDGSHTICSERYGETYHSINGAITESRHVFLEAAGVSQRLAQQQPTRVLEIGFGLGLNFLLTADLALQHGAALDYHAYEHDPSVLLTIASLNYVDWLTDPQVLDKLLSGLADSKQQTQTHICVGQNVTLTLHQADAVQEPLPPGSFDALYLDAFSPDTNPECWTMSFFAKLLASTTPGGMLTTYSAKGSVRRALIAAGFGVKKMAGPPGKREMLHATA
ncbi:tRNA (5-methylaminomethyl-2-thiouridine)(34)-methyltransferase MnmD [Granulosicoccus antarcticus]|uniref:tRNA 5-methylaminomethyl-2-thiouridine biosynthesis bifunctional protein MnmC n=1 Tax=Granulosicoccus antarcticus IMCC3135 TaxID=1192854 RepID=A0A2Z2NSJ3_9GAMM|nr:tRNA (5-methylaminomethyl-2-thiouridine)(34)-methyltransferase MnmD [Granulosicoccus antarcticus]ASJ74526.1 tRNA 5-methylaminomethyl-2-thiouridine biosynthesis bifunctional protein MnmC [Granulosicoccus antarcticus IMCC3135]